MTAYPKPDHEGWEKEYMLAYAKDEVYSGFLNRVASWSKEAEEIQNNEDKAEKTIV